MSAPSTNDIVSGLDLTGYAAVTGAQITQSVNSAEMESDRGIIVTTTDIAGIPEVPNPTLFPAFERYFWRRIGTSAVTPYIWNPLAADHADGSGNDIKKWYTIASSSIGAGTITNVMIADNTITDVKIANLDYSKLIGVPAGAVPTGAAGGDLTGTYPNPSVGASAITTSKVALLNITNALLENGVAGVSGIDLTTKVKVPAIALVVPRVNTGATALEYVAPSAIGARILQETISTIATIVSNAATNLASLTAAPNFNAVGMSDTGFDVQITPLSAASTLFIEVSIPVSISSNGSVCVGLYTATGATPPIAIGSYTSGSATGNLQVVKFVHSVASGSTALRHYFVAFGSSAATNRLNSIDGANVLFGSTKASVKVTEYL